VAARRKTILDVVEAAYAIELDEGAWLDGVLDTAVTTIDRGLGIVGFFFEASGTEPFREWGVTGAGALPSGWREARRQAGGILSDPQVVRRFFLEAPVGTASQRLRTLPDELKASFAAASSMGMMDFAAIVAADPTGFGCVITAPLPAPTPLATHEVQRWSQVAAHVTAGLRLRRSLAGAPEAILSPSGKLVHAEPTAQSEQAREALRNAALILDRVRSARGHRDPDEALGAWEALVSGRWSVVDHFDSDGRRYLVARRNDPDAPARERLTSRECQMLEYAARGHSNKLIAYELGLAVSTVATHIASAASKLGCSSRVALVQLARLALPARPAARGLRTSQA
jgi:DNA-binding CsgD family transcriptional regulator